jgi:methionyl-tRNA synthetase
MAKRILVTAALPYINNVPHMGHIVGSHLPADIFHRCAKAKGHETIFIGGSDEHGTPSVVAAKELGIPPQKLVDGLHDIHGRIYEKLGISYTLYSRTSNPMHHREVQGFFDKIRERGFVKPGKVEMFYCEKDGMFLPDRFIVATCPKCGYGGANADQCEQCSSVLVPASLIDPKCKICGSAPTVRESEHLYLDLQKLGPELAEWVRKQEGTWMGHVSSEAERWISEGLKERSITRDLEWGVRVPLEGYTNKVFYVWFDAPISYITFTRELGQGALEAYWKDPEAQIVHFLGKDNIPFHTIFWPAMLLAHGGFNLPTNVVGYNYLLFEGQKFSKSKGIGVFCYHLLESDIDIDSLRGYLTTIIPETRDATFKWEDYRAFVNAELIGKFGNFFNRTLNLVNKLFGGNLGFAGSASIDGESARAIDAMRGFPPQIAKLIMNAQIRKAFTALMEYASAGNVFLERTEPWKQIRVSPEKTRQDLFIALNMCRSLAITGAPFLPHSMQKMWKEQLKLEGSPHDPGIWDSATGMGIEGDHGIGPPRPLYPRVEDAALDALKSRFSEQRPLRRLIG